MRKSINENSIKVIENIYDKRTEIIQQCKGTDPIKTGKRMRQRDTISLAQ